MIVADDKPVTLIGGAEISKKMLNRAQSLGPLVVAADGGADAALYNGVVPDAVIGDFDSLTDWAREQLPQSALHCIPEQETTDFDKCLRNISAPLVVGVGFSGNRLDHQLAAYNTLVRHPNRPCLLLGLEELVFLCPPSIRLDLKSGTPVSLFPMGAVEGLSDGLRFAIDGVNFTPDGRVGTSNTATGPVEISVTSPKMLVILPQESFEQAAEALLAARSYWPAP
ncbi:thiamine diphosphokinase [uncultured Roseovarius sp.]|uniref:thiamine diphosphokinase n=1 Tax=uncultured Roseovarius sp. TaxID=293344 RepID=UPI0025ED17A1|nr:thiamine diphosphokinase [uncultured Roseovarius sp.]